MRSHAFFLASASLAIAAPFSYPLANGFPALNTTALQRVFQLAGGTLPNGALPASLTSNGAQALQLIAANELFEVAYFTELLQNITTRVRGYEEGHDDKYIIDSLKAIVNVRVPPLFSQTLLIFDSKKKSTSSPPAVSSPTQTKLPSNLANTLSLSRTSNPLSPLHKPSPM
jgi:hypothetical protein